MIIDGKKTAADLRSELKKKVAELKSKYNAVPGLSCNFSWRRWCK